MSSAFDDTTTPTAPGGPAATGDLPAPRARRRPATDVALVATFAAFVAACTLAQVPMPSGVPITLQTFAVALAGLVLGPLRGFLAVALYLVVGLAGVPVFAEFTGGLGALGKASAGYLLSFPLAAVVAGLLARLALRAPRRVRWAALAAAGLGASFLVVHPAGVAGLVWRGFDLPAAFAIDVVFWPGDVVKNVLAGLVAVAVLRAFPDLRPDGHPGAGASSRRP